MRITPAKIQEMKQQNEKIIMISAYDYPTAKIADEVGVELILVGDSLGNVVLGYDSTIPVTVEDVLHHTKAVVKGTTRAMVISDMPFMSYNVSIPDGLRTAARFIQEGGAQAVKTEGGVVVAELVEKIVSCGIPVLGHIGLTPQLILQLGGFKIQGKTEETARKLMDDAIALEQAGAFAVVLETIPTPLATIITKKVDIPTIGIGAGPGCDGQEQIVSDILGLYTDFVPKHTKQYTKLADIIRDALRQYRDEVKGGAFPTEQQSFSMDESILEYLKE